jgi:hypothetical protein
VFVLNGEAGKEALDRWIAWACAVPHSALCVTLRRRIVKHHRGVIDAALNFGLSNALIESTNTNQHQDPADRPRRVRLPRPRTADRSRHSLGGTHPFPGGA